MKTNNLWKMSDRQVSRRTVGHQPGNSLSGNVPYWEAFGNGCCAFLVVGGVGVIAAIVLRLLL